MEAQQPNPAAAATAASKPRKPPGLPLFTQQSLLKDMEATCTYHGRCRDICDLHPDLYGHPGTDLRKSVQYKYRWFKKLEEQDPEKYRRYVAASVVLVEPAIEKEQQESLQQESTEPTTVRGPTDSRTEGGGSDRTSTSTTVVQHEEVTLLHPEGNTLQDTANQQALKIETLQSEPTSTVRGPTNGRAVGGGSDRTSTSATVVVQHEEVTLLRSEGNTLQDTANQQALKIETLQSGLDEAIRMIEALELSATAAVAKTATPKNTMVVDP
jgi:hypothetical protein